MAPPPRMSRARFLAVTKVGLDVALTTAKREQRRARTFMIVGWTGGRLRSKEKRYRLLMVVWIAGIVRKATSTYLGTRQLHRGLTSRLKSNLSEVDTTNSSPPVPERSTSCACLIHSTQKWYERSEGKTIDALEIRLKIRRQLKLNC